MTATEHDTDRARYRARLDELKFATTLDPETTFAAFGYGRTRGYEALRSGAIPSIRIGRRYRIPAEWVRQQLGITLAPPPDPRHAKAPGTHGG